MAAGGRGVSGPCSREVPAPGLQTQLMKHLLCSLFCFQQVDPEPSPTGVARAGATARPRAVASGGWAPHSAPPPSEVWAFLASRPASETQLRAASHPLTRGLQSRVTVLLTLRRR